MKFPITVFAAVLLFFAPLANAASSMPDMSLGDKWDEAIEALELLPVQDTGFVRSSYTFAQNYLSAISGKSSAGEAGALEATLFLLANPARARTIPLIKIGRPKLAEIYGSGHISVEQWRDPRNHQQVMSMLQENQEAWLDPLNSIEYRAQLLEGIDNEFAIVPRDGEWLTPGAVAGATGIDKEIADHWKSLRGALRDDNPAAGAAAARGLSDAVNTAAAQRGETMPNLKIDLFYHKHHPFKKSAFFYLFAALFYGAAMILGLPKLNWVGYALLAAGFLEQVIGVTARWIIAGRAPLSNMYESFTFAVGGMVMVALILEALKSVRLAGIAGSVLGFIFMVIAHKAPIFDSQIRPLMPALQSSWLTYHVVVIMLSYSAFALSFFVSVVYLAKTFLLGGDGGTNLLSRRLPSLAALDVLNYRIIAVGFPLLTLGIIFGAVWAATAWGRPWGFDPKETWSAITWLIYAIYLHVRFLAGWSGRRAAYLSILGFAAVLFTYLGVNYLLPGLHSYV